MSGIEIAGIALAVFPIAIKGLQHFPEGIESLKVWKHYRHVINDYCRRLEVQHAIYDNTIALLLEGIIQLDEDSHAALQSSKGTLLQYEDKLRLRLGQSYDVYQSTMEKMVEALTTARDVLKLDTDGKARWERKAFLERLMARIELVFLEKRYVRLLATIKEANEALNQLTEQNRALEKSRERRRFRRHKLDFGIVRHNARSLYNTLIREDSWTCRCRRQHVVKLRLEPRPWRVDKSEDDLELSSILSFQVLLSKMHFDAESKATWRWQDLEVEPMPLLDTPASVDCTGSSALDMPKPQPLHPTRNVSFALDPNPRPSWPAMPTTPPEAWMKPINDLCFAMQMLNHNNIRQGIGYLVDKQHGHCRHALYAADRNTHREMNSQSLEYFLGLPEEQHPGLGLTQCDRLYIAFTLASSVLQLDGTFWLRRQWTSGDIRFLSVWDTQLSSERMDFAKPYVSWNVLKDDLNRDEQGVSNTMVLPYHIPSEPLAFLGLALTELCFGRKMSRMRMQEDNDPSGDEQMTNLNTASRLVRGVRREMGDKYEDAVQRCLKCPPDVRDPDMDNEELQMAVYDKIVIPLKEVYEIFSGSRALDRY